MIVRLLFAYEVTGAAGAGGTAPPAQIFLMKPRAFSFFEVLWYPVKPASYI